MFVLGVQRLWWALSQIKEFLYLHCTLIITQYILFYMKIFKYSRNIQVFPKHNKLMPINRQTLYQKKSTIHTKGNTLLANIGFIACEEKKKRIPHQLTCSLISNVLPELQKGLLSVNCYWQIAKRTITKNRMQMIISPTRLTQHQRVLRELEGI